MLYIKCFHREAKLCFSQEAPRWGPLYKKYGLVKERYTHLNAGFQKIARRYKKAFLREQCKEIEESNKMGKIRDLFKKIKDTKWAFHAKMGTIKDRNCMAEDIKNRWQEYTKELY